MHQTGTEIKGVVPDASAVGLLRSSPSSTVVLFQSGLSSVDETTYLGIELNLSANWSDTRPWSCAQNR